MRKLSAAMLLALLSTTFVTYAQAPQNVTRCPATLPAPVVATVDTLRALARQGDYAGLRKLVKKPDDFAWGYGGEGDPTPEWQRARQQGLDPAAMLVGLLGMACIVQRTDGRTLYHWPPATHVAWKDLTAADRASLEAFYGNAIDKAWQGGRAGGFYVGWQLTILFDGTWSAFMMPE